MATLMEIDEQTPTESALTEASNFIRWPHDLPDRTLMGGKASALAQLAKLVPIPDWFVITPQAFLVSHKAGVPLDKLQMSPAVATAIRKAVARLDATPSARFAVRSSAIAEDGATASFAGQLQSFLHLSQEELSEHVCKVWQSAFAEGVQRYQQQIAGQREDCIPAVIVQRMVQADVAGVAFSVEPVSGDRTRCTITAAAGVADQLVAGEVNGDVYFTDRSGTVQSQTIVADLPLLSPAQIAAIVEMVLYVENHFGTPQDMEWAIENGQLFLLQARPVTGQKSAGHSLPTLWDNSNIVESYSGVTSPLTFSFARYAYEHVYIAFCKLMGVSQRKIEDEQNAFRNMLGFINGHVYYNLINWYRVLALFPGFKLNRHFMEQMMGVKQALPPEVLAQILPAQSSRWERMIDGLQLARAGLGLIWNQITLKHTIRRFYGRLDEALTRSTAELQSLSLEALAAEYATVESKLLTRWDAPLVNDFLCMIAFGLSRKVLERWAGEAGLQLHNDILIGQGDIISAEPARRIQAMAATAAADPALVETLIQEDISTALAALAEFPALQRQLDAYLVKFGNRCLQELKLESPTLQDDPSSLLRAIGQMAKRAPVANPSASFTSLVERLHELLPNQPFRRWLATRLANWAKARVRDRENLRFERTRVFGHARQIFLAMGRHLCERTLLDDAKDIFLLEVGEVRALVNGAVTLYDLRGLVALRKREQSHFATLPTPPNRFTSDGCTVDAIGTALRYVQSIQNEGVELQPANAERRGIGCCAGIVRATVRIIHDPRSQTVAAGEIMVARFTDPGWITLFANAAGILVERGSLLSHSAIVARELGIPAIVAIDGVMDWLQTGDRVEMNGGTGVIRKI